MPTKTSKYKLTLLAVCILAALGSANGQKRFTKKNVKQKSSRTQTAPVQKADVPAPGKATRQSVAEAEVGPLPRGVEHFEEPVTREEKGKTVEIGKVDWTTQYIEATGQGVIDLDRYKNPAQAKLLARRAAVVVAQRNLLEIAKGVAVQGETTVEDMMTTRDIIVTRVDGIVKGAQEVGQPMERDGIVEVRLRMPLYGEKSLASSVVDQLPPAEEATAPDSMLTQPTGTTAKGDTPLVFNLNGKKIDPALFPVVVDESGKVVLDMRKLADKNGKLPPILKTTGDITKVLKDMGVKGKILDSVINVLNAEDGKITISDADAGKFPWKKILNVAAKVGKFLLLLI